MKATPSPASGGAASPLVSIIVPTFNRADMLPEALDSCLAQTYRNVEIVVVNDGSSDHTADVLERYAARDPRVRCFSKPNEGIADTLNFGHAQARGDYLTWSSDDNLYYPDAIASMVEVLESRPELGLVYADARFIDGENRVLKIVQPPEPEAMLKEGFIQAAVLYRRAVFAATGGYRRRWVRCQDFDFYIRAYKVCKVAHLPRVIYDYRLHEMSMSGNHAALVMENAALLDSHAESHAARRAVWAYHLGYLGRHFENRWQFWRAAAYYGRAIPYQGRRIRDCGRVLGLATYASLPEGVKTAWRWLKRRVRHGG